MGSSLVLRAGIVVVVFCVTWFGLAPLLRPSSRATAHASPPPPPPPPPTATPTAPPTPTAGLGGCANISYLDHCTPSPCENGGACLNFHHTFYCACHPGFHGLKCDKQRASWAYPKGNKPCKFIQEDDTRDKVAALDSLSYATPFEPKNTVDAAERFTVVLNTFRRNALLKVAVGNYLRCARVAQVRVSWSDQQHKPPADQDKAAFFKENLDGVVPARLNDVIFDTYKTDSLNNRFHPLAGLKHDAVFSVDDDMQYTCAQLDFTFRVWQEQPDKMVGFEPRIPFKDAEGAGWRYIWNQALKWGIYNMVLVTKGGFLHKRFFEAYTNQLPRPVLDYVTKNLNCEDIVMSYLVANMTKVPAVWVRITPKAMKWSGRTISKNDKGEIKQHGIMRNQCCAYMEEVFKGFPLVLAHRSVQPPEFPPEPTYGAA